MTDRAKEYWREFASANPDIKINTPFQAWFFGNDAEMARELAELVISGTKTATASLNETNVREPENEPIEDGYSVVTNFHGDPMCIIQTTEIRRVQFKDVDADFAFDEGEGDRTLSHWSDVHWRYFSREASEKGLEFNENSMVCCER